jgi:hypothetical protein
MTWLDWLKLTGEMLGQTFASFGPYLAVLLPVVAWCAWWLGGVNWKKCWPMLASGGWVPVVLLAGVAVLAWTKLRPGDVSWAGGVTIPHGWWQAGAVAGFVAAALFCGWLQGYFGWTPQEIAVEPPAHGHGHDHGDGHH